MTTPMFQQYHALKQENPNAILMFRMGDFYEMFFDDAVLAADILDVTLTTRNKKDPEPIPMAGVPHHAVESYVQRLVDAGHRVAMADQVEDPATAKGIVRRAVVRVVTPGVVLNPSLVAAKESNYLCAVSKLGEAWGLAFLDSTTGELRITATRDPERAAAEVARHQPKEALVAPHAMCDALRHTLKDVPLGPLEPSAWNGQVGLATVGKWCPEDCAAIQSSHAAAPALGAIAAYVEATQGSLHNVQSLRHYSLEQHLVLDETTRANLELTRTLRGHARKGSLLGLMDRTKTSAGARLLRDWLSSPLQEAQAILRRQEGVGGLVTAPAEREALQRALRHVADIERLAARIAQGTAHPRDLSGLRRSLAACPDVNAAVRDVHILRDYVPDDRCADVLDDLQRTLTDDPPAQLTEGGLIREGIDPDLDELTHLAMRGVSTLNDIESREREATGIPSLKIKQNRIFGYFIEVTSANLHKVPERYLRKQTLSNCERYITEELKELEGKLLGADERRKALEHALFLSLRERVAGHIKRLLALARTLAQLDVLASLADIAQSEGWTRPTLGEGTELRIDGGRHPIVEQAQESERFVPNDVQFTPDEQQMILITGPNMSGKSTFMRQVALIAVMAQMGSYVPADHAHIGLVDRIFTRVGASDDLAAGQSTFMVEMSETATILTHATKRSLVILDEIGRGTSTYDGLAIAWAVAEDLHQRIGCRTLFATHYHELTLLADRFKTVVNQSVAVTEHKGQIIFLRKLRQGSADRSYGIQCARLAGLPELVLKRAAHVLHDLETRAPRNENEQLSFFGSTPPPDEVLEVTPPSDPLRDALLEIQPDDLSPRDALAALYTLRDLV